MYVLDIDLILPCRRLEHQQETAHQKEEEEVSELQVEQKKLEDK